VDEKYIKMLKIARYYYEEGLTQQKISNKMNLSRPTISKLLNKAKEEGIVQINIVDNKNKSYILELEEKMIDSFNIKDVKIIEYNKNSKMNLKEKLGRAAADYFEKNILTSNLKIGVAWGYTLKHMVDYLKQNKSISGVEVISILGGSGKLKSDVNANDLCRKIANKYNGLGYFLYAPVILDDKITQNTIRNNHDIKEVLEKGKHIDLALVGIGEPIETSLLLKTGYFGEKEIDELKSCNAIGDICARFYDLEGSVCKTKMNEKVIGLSIEDLKNIGKVIGIAGGNNKVKSILGSLRGELIDILITDSITANKILKYNNKHK